MSSQLIRLLFLRKYLFTSVIMLFVFVGLFSVSSKFIYTFGFTDEGDNISIGKFLLNEKTLYKDIFSQHQPLTYYISSTIQQAAPADNILLVVRRHRQFIIFFSLAWIAFLTYRFGHRMLPFLFSIELLKYYYLGHLFLAEGLVIYPLSYIFCLFWQAIHTRTLSRFDAITGSLAAFFVVFNVLPAVLGVLVMLLVTVLFLKQKKELLVYLLLPCLLATCLLFLFVPLRDYFDAAIFANIFYYAPNSTQYAATSGSGASSTLLLAVFWPFIYLYKLNNGFATAQILLSCMWFIFAIGYVRETKRYWMPVLIYGVLVLLNTRPPSDSLTFFHAFHSLPFFAIFLLSLGLFWSEIDKTNLLKRKWVYAAPIIVLFCFYIFNADFYFREKMNEGDTSYIQFNTVISFSDTIRSLSRPGDTLAVIPYEELLYWYPGLFPPTRFLFYEGWVYGVPEYKAEIDKGLQTNPPTFVYSPSLSVTPYLKDIDYISLPQGSATMSALFVQKKRLPSIREEQWKSAARYGFIKPQ